MSRHMLPRERTLKWVKQKNKCNPKLLQVVSSGDGESVFLIAMSDKKRPIKLCSLNVYEKTDCLKGYRLDAVFAADGVDAIVDKEGNHLGYKFQRPYLEINDDQDLEHALWVYVHENEKLPDFDFSIVLA